MSHSLSHPLLREGSGYPAARRPGFSLEASHSRRDCVGFSPTCFPVTPEKFQAIADYLFTNSYDTPMCLYLQVTMTDSYGTLRQSN